MSSSVGLLGDLAYDICGHHSLLGRSITFRYQSFRMEVSWGSNWGHSEANMRCTRGAHL